MESSLVRGDARPLQTSGSARLLRLLGSALAAGVLTGWAAIVVDALARESWAEVNRLAHLGGALFLYTAAGAALGVLGWLVALPAALLAGGGRWRQRARRALPPAMAALAATLIFRDTALVAFAGHGVAGSALARWGPAAFLGLIGGGSVALAIVVDKGLEAASGRRPRRALAIAGLLWAGAGVLALIDMTVLVALYSSIHVMLETFVAVSAAAGFAIAIATLRTRRELGRLFAGTGALALVTLAWLLVSAGSRAALDEHLVHVWREPVYVGRMLYRVQLAEAYLRDPAAWDSARASRLRRLKQRYDISNVALSPAWEKPPAEPPQLTRALTELRQGKHDFNLVVFYVDTLRHDVASDPSTMPNMVELAKKSLWFRRSYSFASDTVTSLPVLTGGSYMLEQRLQSEREHDIFRLAERAKLPTALFIATSARRFLNKLLPSFRFEHTVDVPDYAPDKKVWGYGADRSSAQGVVDEALAWIDGRTSERFFAWLFHFDVHNWRELDDAYLDDTAQRHGIDDPRHRHRRYKAAAAGVDEALGRFVAGLEERGLAERTIILAVADHGEALGRQGHWVHAVFLWESLIRTPLILHVPGMEPRVIDEPVGHADVPPTLARFLDPHADVSAYHGYDLLTHLVPAARRGELPILLTSLQKEDVLRIGLIDRKPPFHKLVLPLDSAEPELHDLSGLEPDDFDFARQRRALTLALLSQLVRSPVFPREHHAGPGDASGAGRTALMMP